MGKGKKLAVYSNKPASEDDKETKRDKAINSIKLTNNKQPKMVVSFGLKLENKYNFKNLTKDDLRAFQSFLDDSTELSFDEMEKRYLRKPDTDDFITINDVEFQVQHFGKNGSPFRIHGIYAKGSLHVIRIDAKHQVHKS